MTDQPVSEAPPLTSAQPAMLPDWQQIALLLLWRLLPAENRTITITPQDFADVMAAFPAGPVMLFRPSAEATMIGLATREEAEELTAAYNASLPSAQNAPASGALQ